MVNFHDFYLFENSTFRQKTNKPHTAERQPALLPYVKCVTDRIGNILRRASIITIIKPNKKVSQFLRPVKSNIPLQSAGVYQLDCDCGLSYKEKHRC